MKPTNAPADTPLFRLKGGVLSTTVLELGAVTPAALERELAQRIEQAPQLFRQAPLVIALDRLPPGTGALDLSGLLDLCRRLALQPVGVRALRPDDLAQAQALGIALLPPAPPRMPPAAAADAGAALDPVPVVPELSAERQHACDADGTSCTYTGDGTDPRLAESPPTPAASGEAGAAMTSASPVVAPATRLVTHPVRGGQQVYAPGDLVLLAPVSAGAEVMAGGHIHAYAPLRGRALAGVEGDVHARLFCRELAAELVAIAGHFRVADTLRADPCWGRSAQVLLEEEELRLVAL